MLVLRSFAKPSMVGARFAQLCLEDGTDKYCYCLFDMVEPRTKLTLESFATFLQTLSADRQLAGERYEDLRRGLIKFFQWRGSLQAEQDADETIDRLVLKVSQTTVEDVYRYAVGIARNVALETIRHQQKERSAVAASTVTVTLPGEDEEFDSRLECFENCLAQLPSEKRNLILEYYEGDKQTKIANRRRLARAAAMPIGRLRIQAHRIRQQLHNCIEQCLTKRGS